MAKKAKCKFCGNEVELRENDWSLTFKFHKYELAGQKIECKGSGTLVK